MKYIAKYWRYYSLDEEEWDTERQAFMFLLAGEDHGECSSQGVYLKAADSSGRVVENELWSRDSDSNIFTECERRGY